jgi:flagellar hook-associated protein 3 FlgL
MTTLTAANQQFVSNLNRIQTLMTKAQSEASTGIAVNNASDAPDQISAILQLHADIQQNKNVQSNLTTLQATVDTADQSMSSAISLLDQVQSLATQGLGLTTTANTRSILASQVATIMQQLVSISNTQVSGTYIFSGNSDQSPSYQLDANAATGVDRLQVSTSTQQAQDGSGGSFAVALSANDIFDARDSSDKPTGNNVFAAVNAVRVALLNNDTTALQTATGSMQTASTYLNQQQSFYGTVENRITASLTQLGNNSLSLQTDLTNRTGADEASAMVAMQQYSTTLQAAIAAQAKIPTTTLFDELR